MTQTVVGIFDSPDAAHYAEEVLVSRGIERSALHLSTTDPSSSGTQGESTTGGIRGFFSGLFDTGHKQEAEHYSEAIRRGSVMLAVDVPDNAPVEPVCEALESAGAVDIDQRVEQWRQQGWTGYNPEAQPYSTDEIANERSTVLPVIQEEIEIGKRQVPKGVVRVFSRTVETPVHETVNLREEHATIEHRPADRAATPADLNAFDEKSVEVTEMAEKAVVSKSARVVEEVVVGKEVSQSTESIDDTVRHTEVKVERGVAEGVNTLRSFEDYEPEYRQDFQSRYAAQGGTFDDYAPAYRYGHSLASDPRYQGRAWNEIEPAAQLDWERQHRGSSSTWERFKMAVQHGWQRVSGQR